MAAVPTRSEGRIQVVLLVTLYAWPLVLGAIWHLAGALIASITLGGGAVGLALLISNWLLSERTPRRDHVPDTGAQRAGHDRP